jgi:DNA polymerase III alpha subunit
MPDIDIDFVDREQALGLFKHVRASREEEDNHLVKHNTGVYLHEVPINAVTGLCAVPYETAEDRGYFKIDFLNVSIYKGVRDEAHLNQLMETEPLWDLLEQTDFTDLLFHVSGHGNVLKTMKPKSIEQLAAVLAIIRPAKKNLLGKSWDEVLEQVWQKPTTDEYYFKKSHAIAYATAIVVQMNLICEGISYGYN